MSISVKGITSAVLNRVNESAKISFPKYPNLPVPESCEQFAENDAHIFAYSVMLLLSPAIFLINLFRSYSGQPSQEVNPGEIKK